MKCWKEHLIGHRFIPRDRVQLFVYIRFKNKAFRNVDFVFIHCMCLFFFFFYPWEVFLFWDLSTFTSQAPPFLFNSVPEGAKIKPLFLNTIVFLWKQTVDIPELFLQAVGLMLSLALFLFLPQYGVAFASR